MKMKTMLAAVIAAAAFAVAGALPASASVTGGAGHPEDPCNFYCAVAG